MRILIYGINYAPELTGIGKYTAEMCSFLASEGHQVEVITAMPYYPTWKVHQQYRGKLWHTEMIDGVKVRRCPLFVPQKVTARNRILQEMTFIISSLPIWFMQLFVKKKDVVINISPPFHLGVPAIVYAFLRRSTVITHIQDLQIDVARDLGMIKNSLALKILFSAERFVLKNSTVVSTISNGMKEKILSKGITNSRCLLLPNWVDEQEVRPIDRKFSLRDMFGLNQTDKVVLYSGNLGEKQGLENIIEAAIEFKNHTDLKFVIVGSGGVKKKLQQQAADARLNNVVFFPLQQYEHLSALLAIADLHLILQKRSASDLVMPSKLTSILAAGGVPLVTAVKNSNIYDVVTNHKLGITVEPDNVNALINGIKDALFQDLRELSLNARRYAELHLSKKSIMKNFVMNLENIICNKAIRAKEIRVNEILKEETKHIMKNPVEIVQNAVY